MSKPTKTCRNCGCEITNRTRHFPHFYGGYTCSDRCDDAVTERMKRSIDEHHDPSGYYRRNPADFVEDYS